jgi:PhnB protein
MVHDVEGLIAFTKQAFGAEETFRTIGAAGGTHCEVKLGDSMVMIGGGGKWQGPEMPAALHLYVEDADAVYQSALAAGATSIMEVQTFDDGDRRGGVQDAFGNQWYMSTHLGSE